MNAHSNKDLIESMCSRLNSGDVASVMELFDDSIAWSISLRSDYVQLRVIHTKDGLQDHLHEVLAEFRHFKLTPERFAENGNRVVVHARSDTTTKNGRVRRGLHVLDFTIDDGLISNATEQIDPFKVLGPHLW